MSNPQCPIFYVDLKRFVRMGLTETARQIWWPHLPNIREGSFVKELENIESTAEKLLEMVLVNQNDNDVNILQLLVDTRRCQTTELIASFFFVFSQVVTRKDVQYIVLCDLLALPSLFHPQDHEALNRHMAVFRLAVKSLMPKTFDALESMHGLDSKYLELIFKDFFVQLIPMKEIYRIMDVFLLEGKKILFRYGLALIELFKKEIKSGKYTSGRAFWQYVMSVGPSNAGGIDYGRIHDLAFDQQRSVFMKLYHPMKIGRNFLYKSIEDIKVNKEDLDAEKSPLDNNNPDLFDSIRQSSRILDDQMCQFLLKGLPRVHEWQLMYASYRDGWSMSTFFLNCRPAMSSFIVIRSLKIKAVIGCYFTGKIVPNTSTGDGHSLCFRLDGNNAILHHWVGLHHPEEVHGTSTSKFTGDNNGNPLNVNSSTYKATLHQFMHFGMDYFTLGGSEEHGTNAIRVSGDLRHCSTGYSDTFGNLPLIPWDMEASPFEVSDIEVYGNVFGSMEVVNMKSILD